MSSTVGRRRPSIFLLVSLVAMSMASRSLAHEQKVALTDIFYNERTGNLEIAHRISLHDAENALHEVSDSSFWNYGVQSLPHRSDGPSSPIAE